MNFIKRAVASNDLPWHLTCKTIGFCDGPLGWKFETSIFDYFNSAQVIKALLFPRSQCFAPLKNIEGSDSLDTVQKALLNNDLSTLESICGHAIPAQTLELDQQFHYPTEELLTTWKGRKGSFHGYITSYTITETAQN